MKSLLIATFCALICGVFSFQFKALESWPEQSLYASWSLNGDEKVSDINYRKTSESTWTTYNCSTKNSVCLDQVVFFDMELAEYEVQVTVLDNNSGRSSTHSKNVEVIQINCGQNSNTKALTAFMCIFLLTTIVLGILLALFWRKAYQQERKKDVTSSKMAAIFAVLPFKTKLPGQHPTETSAPNIQVENVHEGKSFNDSKYSEVKSDEQPITTSWVPPPKQKQRPLTTNPQKNTYHNTHDRSQTLSHKTIADGDYLTMDGSKKEKKQKEESELEEHIEQHDYLDLTSQERQSGEENRLSDARNSQNDFEQIDYEEPDAWDHKPGGAAKRATGDKPKAREAVEPEQIEYEDTDHTKRKGEGVVQEEEYMSPQSQQQNTEEGGENDESVYEI